MAQETPLIPKELHINTPAIHQDPHSNPIAITGIPKQDQSNTEAIPQQYHNKNIAAIPPAISQQSPSNAKGNSTSIPQGST